MHNTLDSHLGASDPADPPWTAGAQRRVAADASPVRLASDLPDVALSESSRKADRVSSASARTGRFRRPLIARLLARPLLFRLLERVGLHLTRVHYYQPIPDTRALGDSLWDRCRSPSLPFNIEAQNDLLHHLSTMYGSELQQFLERSKRNPDGFRINNRAFESVDAEMLYWIVRAAKPNRVIEVGAGHSTLLVREALEATTREDPSRQCEHTVIDPYPADFLHGRTGDAKVRAIPIQSAPLGWIEELECGDVLFLDSTHVVRTGSDVVHEILEILPRLKPGVLVHFHDIFTPFEYPKSWVKKDHRFWTEQYLLEAFLACNSDFEILWSGHLMHRESSLSLSHFIPSYNPVTTAPGSFWIRRRSAASALRVGA